MQLPFSCLPFTQGQIEATMSPARLARFQRVTGGDKHFALRLYVWNARICESLYFPLQVAEVTARNAIAKPVQRRFGERWFDDHRFQNLLPMRHKETLMATRRKERGKRGSALNQDHMVAGLPFGFWVNLMTSSYDRQLWANGVAHSFPNHGGRDREGIRSVLDRMRNFRNDVAHHFAIFDRNPQAQYQNALTITGLICEETQWLVKEVSQVSKVINERPRF